MTWNCKMTPIPIQFSQEEYWMTSDISVIQTNSINYKFSISNSQITNERIGHGSASMKWSRNVLNQKKNFKVGNTLYVHPTITLCNTIFVPGFQVLYFNCLCPKPMEKRLHSAQTFILWTQPRKISYLLWQNKEIFTFLFMRWDKKQHLHGK